jgi:Uma2 family endonuclease
MATAATIPVEQYLATTYRPDRDYIDGELRERNVGEYLYGALQARFGFLFNLNAKRWGVRVSTEQRLRVAPKRIRIPDVCVFEAGAPIDPVPATPPLICIEILSKDDTLASLEDRIDDYLAFGVPNVWVFDPVQKRAYTCDLNGIHPAREGFIGVPGTAIQLPLVEVFTEI